MCRAERDLPFDTFLHFAVTYDGSGKAAGVKMYVNGQLEKTNVVSGHAHRHDQDAGRRSASGVAAATAPPFTGRVDDFRVYQPRARRRRKSRRSAAARRWRSRRSRRSKRTPEQKAQLQKFYRETQAPEYAAAQKKVADLKKAKDGAGESRFRTRW